MLVKEIKPGLDKWRKRWFSQVRKLIIVKMSILPKLIYRFNVIPIRSPASFCSDRQDYSERIAPAIFKKKNKMVEISLSDFKTCCVVTEIMTLCH